MSKNKEIAIEVKDLSKHFRLPTERASGIKQAAINRFKGVKGYKEQKVLRNISFNVEKGDFFGIVGRNGSGKSTLLKLISGIYMPDNGSITVNGSMVSFIELGVGFNAQLTGRENIYLNGALLGFSVKEIDAMYDEIVDFAELRDFMDQKLKNYSSGMQVRLAFSCAIRAKSDILVLDEVLAVGDEAFQRKCNDYFEVVCKDQNQTVILVTHSMDAVRKYCNKALLIGDGLIEQIGNPDDIANQYVLESFDQQDKKKPFSKHGDKVSLKALSKQFLVAGDKLEFEVVYNSSKDKKQWVGITLWADNVPLFADETRPDCVTNRKGRHSFKYSFDTSDLNQYAIKVTATVYDLVGVRAVSKPVVYTDETTSLHFEIQSPNKRIGLVRKCGQWVTQK
jgi:ABC-2 type transport system ATP-binding protein